MGAKESIISSFKQLVLTDSYESISVNQICSAANVSRKTFYVHFQNKAAIVNAIVYNDIIEPMVQLNSIFDTMFENVEMVNSLSAVLNENVYKALKKDRAFYSKLCAMPGSIDSPLVDALTMGIQSVNIMVMDLIGYEVEPWRKDYISYYYAVGNALLIQRWIRGGMVIPIDELASLYNNMTTPFWKAMSGLA